MLYAFFGALVAQLPLLLAYAAGVVLVLINRRNYPRAASFLLIAAGLSFIVQMLSTAFYLIILPNYLMRDASASAMNYGYYTYAAGVITNIGHAAAFGLMIAAVFAGRVPPINNQPR